MKALGLLLLSLVGCVHVARVPEAVAPPDDVLDVSLPRQPPPAPKPPPKYWTPKDADEEAVAQVVFVRMLASLNAPPRPMACLTVKGNLDLGPGLRQQIADVLSWPKPFADQEDCLPLVLAGAASYEGQPKAWVFTVESITVEGDTAVVRTTNYCGMECASDDEYTLQRQAGVWRIVSRRNIRVA